MGVERTGGATRSGREEAAGDWSALVGLCASPLAAALGGILRRSVAIDADPWSLAFVHATFYVGFGLLAASALMGTRTTRARSLIFLFWAAVFAAACFVELAQGAFTATTGAPVNASLLVRATHRLTDVVLVGLSIGRPRHALLLVAWVAIVTMLCVRTRVWRVRPVVCRGKRVALALAGGVLIAVPPVLAPGERPITRWPSIAYLAVDATRRSPSPQVLPPPTSPATIERVGPGRPPNIVVIILESTSFTSTTLGRPELDTTPFLAQLAGDSMVAVRAHAVVPHTTKSAVAILCGYSPRLVMQVTESEPGGLHSPCLPHLLEPFGYTTAFFRSATGEFEGWTSLIANQGFDHVVVAEDLDTRGWRRVNLFGYEDDILLEPSRAWLERQESPFLAVYLTGTPHFEYALPDAHMVATYSEIPEQNRHLNGVRYVDAFVGRLLEQYRHLHRLDDTIVVVVGDHGEAFGEHRRWQHDAVPWDEVARVPLLVHVPGRTWDRPVVREGVNHLDIVPTVLDLAGFRLQGGSYPGSPIHQVKSERRLFFQCWYADTCAASMSGALKAIDHADLRPPQLFHRDLDPGEVRDRATEAWATIEIERAAMRHWRDVVEARYAQRARDPIALEDLVTAVRPAVTDADTADASLEAAD